MNNKNDSNCQLDHFLEALIPPPDSELRLEKIRKLGSVKCPLSLLRLLPKNPTEDERAELNERIETYIRRDRVARLLASQSVT